MGRLELTSINLNHTLDSHMAGSVLSQPMVKCVGALECCTRNWFIIMKWELRFYVSVYIKDQMINLKPAISNKSSSSQTNRQQKYSPYANQTAQPILRVNLINERYGLVVACARRLRNLQLNLHLNLCGAPGLSVCCTRSTKSSKISWCVDYAATKRYMDRKPPRRDRFPTVITRVRDRLCLSTISQKLPLHKKRI